MENENTEVKAEAEKAETETWQNDSHKKMFGRYSSEWDWHHTACRLDIPQKKRPANFLPFVNYEHIQKISGKFVGIVHRQIVFSHAKMRYNQKKEMRNKKWTISKLSTAWDSLLVLKAIQLSITHKVHPALASLSNPLSVTQCMGTSAHQRYTLTVSNETVTIAEMLLTNQHLSDMLIS